MPVLDPSRPIGPDNILWPDDMPLHLRISAQAEFNARHIAELERAAIEAAISKRRCDLEVERLETRHRDSDLTSPNFPLLEKRVSADAAAYKASLALEELVDTLIAAREKQ